MPSCNRYNFGTKQCNEERTYKRYNFCPIGKTSSTKSHYNIGILLLNVLHDFKHVIPRRVRFNAQPDAHDLIAKRILQAFVVLCLANRIRYNDVDFRGVEGVLDMVGASLRERDAR